MGSRYPAAHELFMGVYHSHSIQIARLIERAYPFARPPPASPFPYSTSPPPRHAFNTSSRIGMLEPVTFRPANEPFPRSL